MEIEIFNVTKGWMEQPELTQHQMVRYFRTLQHDGLLEYCFFDGSVRTYVDFFAFCLDRMNLFMIVYEQNTQNPLAHVVLNGFEGYASRIHFGMPRAAHGRHRSLDIATKTIGEVFRMTRHMDETPLTSTLVGVTPTRNRLACRFVQDLGFRPIATLEKSCYYAKDKTFSDGLMTMLTKTQFEEGVNGWQTGSRSKATGRV